MLIHLGHKLVIEYLTSFISEVSLPEGLAGEDSVESGVPIFSEIDLLY